MPRVLCWLFDATGVRYTAHVGYFNGSSGGAAAAQRRFQRQVQQLQLEWNEVATPLHHICPLQDHDPLSGTSVSTAPTPAFAPITMQVLGADVAVYVPGSSLSALEAVWGGIAEANPSPTAAASFYVVLSTLGDADSAVNASGSSSTGILPRLLNDTQRSAAALQALQDGEPQVAVVVGSRAEVVAGERPPFSPRTVLHHGLRGRQRGGGCRVHGQLVVLTFGRAVYPTAAPRWLHGFVEQARRRWRRWMQIIMRRRQRCCSAPWTCP